MKPFQTWTREDAEYAHLDSDAKIKYSSTNQLTEILQAVYEATQNKENRERYILASDIDPPTMAILILRGFLVSRTVTTLTSVTYKVAW